MPTKSKIIDKVNESEVEWVGKQKVRIHINLLDVLRESFSNTYSPRNKLMKRIEKTASMLGADYVVLEGVIREINYNQPYHNRNPAHGNHFLFSNVNFYRKK